MNKIICHSLRLYSKIKGFIQWGWPIFALITTVYAVRSILIEHNFTPSDDARVLVFMGITYLIATIFVLFTAENFNFRNLGQLATYFADAYIYLGSGAAFEGWRHKFDSGDANTIRSLFLTGGPLLVIGLFWWSIKKYSSREDKGRLYHWCRRIIIRIPFPFRKKVKAYESQV